MLRLIPLPGKREIICIPFRNLHDAIKAVPAILKEGILPVGIEWTERDVVNLVEQYTGKEVPLHDYEAFLMIIVEADNEDEFASISSRIGDICLKHGAVDIFIPGSTRAKRNLLDAREKFYPVLRHYKVLDLADIVVPRSRIAEFVERTKKIANKHGVQIVAYGHAGDGNVHLHPIGQKVDKHEEQVKKLLTEIYKLGTTLGGTISGEHGLGFAKKGYLNIAADKTKIDLMKRIKQAFDPNNILNPGKVLDLEQL